jgi:hypothetical protein
MKLFVLFFLLIFYLSDYAQVEDKFTDGNFTLNPNWVGSDTKFEVNNSFQLHTKSTISDTAFLAVENKLNFTNDVEWRLWMKLSFSPSSNNFSRFYLVSNMLDLRKNPDGYYLQFGESGSNDAIRLFKQKSSISTQIFSGNLGTISSNFILSLKVNRDANGDWKIYTDFNGNENFTLEASANDPELPTGKFSGLYCQFTKTYASKFYFDNFYCGPKIVDKTPPILQQIQVLDNTHLKLTFSETVDSVSATDVSNYSLLNETILIAQAARDVNAKSCVLLQLDSPLSNAKQYTLMLSQLSDITGNKLEQVTKSFYYILAEKPEKGDVIINEIMSNPSPPIALPEIEYVEIFNKSNKYFNLKNWVLSDGNTTGKISDAWIAPNEYKVLCNANALAFVNNSIGVHSFPSLNNSGDLVQLLDSNNQVIDLVRYETSWYVDSEKAKGGYGLERINPYHPCSDKLNWKVTESNEGGTPGDQNSIFDTLPSLKGLSILTANLESDTILQVSFSASVDSASVMNAMYAINPNVTILSKNFINKELTINIEKPAIATTYQLNIQHINDCWNKSYDISSEFARTEQPNPLDICINELLVNPVSGACDFVEIYNTSQKWVNLKGLQFANYEQDVIANIKTISENRILKPGEYAFVTPSISKQKSLFSTINESVGCEMALPGYNNDSGTVILLKNNTIIDKVSYKDKWHFALIDNTEGKSLERINPFANSCLSDNWHTASETVGYATPGLQNSHYLSSDVSQKTRLVVDRISPENDGFEDILELVYQTDLDENMCTITILNAEGQEMIKLKENELIPQNGSVFWDGLTSNKQKAPVGMYIIYFQSFNLKSGKTYFKKLPFLVAGKI